MKKLLLFTSIALLTAVSASAQCTPDPQFTSPGIYPDSAAGFANGCVNVAYTQLITNVVPADTCVIIVNGFPCQTVSIDSIKITSFTGLPAGFTYASYDAQNTTSPPDQGTFEGGTTGCVSISGTTAVAGIYNLVINVDVYAGGSSSVQGTQVIDWYHIEILAVPTISMSGSDLVTNNATGNQWQLDGFDIVGETGQTLTPLANGSYTVIGDCGTSSAFVMNNVGMNENELSNFSVYPNPASSSLSINGLNGVNFSAVVITNLSGAKVKEVRTSSASKQTIDISDLENGIYLIQVETSANKEVIRFVKK